MTACMAKPKASADLTQTAFRAPAEMIEALDRWAERLNETTHARWSRNAIILAGVERALKERGEKGASP